MKKVLIFCLVMVLAFSMSLTVVADDGGFVSSPTGKAAPILVEAKSESEDCEASLNITSYTDRAQLPEENRKAIEDAYAQIKATYDLSRLNVKLSQLALELGVPVSDLAVSDLFDISCEKDTDHDDHGKFQIKLKTESAQNFVCLLHYINDEWVIIENADADENGRHITFSEADFSPFAIVVYDGNRIVRSEVEVENEVNKILVTVSVVTTTASIGTTIWAISEKLKNRREAA